MTPSKNAICCNVCNWAFLCFPAMYRIDFFIFIILLQLGHYAVCYIPIDNTNSVIATTKNVAIINDALEKIIDLLSENNLTSLGQNLLVETEKINHILSNELPRKYIEHDSRSSYNERTFQKLSFYLSHTLNGSFEPDVDEFAWVQSRALYYFIQEYLLFLKNPFNEFQNGFKYKCKSFEVDSGELIKELNLHTIFIPQVLLYWNNYTDDSFNAGQRIIKQSVISECLIYPLCQLFNNSIEKSQVDPKQKLLNEIKKTEDEFIKYDKQRKKFFYQKNIIKNVIQKNFVGSLSKEVNSKKIYFALANNYHSTGYSFIVGVGDTPFDNSSVSSYGYDDVVISNISNNYIFVLRSISILKCENLEKISIAPNFREVCESTKWGSEFKQIQEWVSKRCPKANSLVVINNSKGPYHITYQRSKIYIKNAYLSWPLFGFINEYCYPNVTIIAGVNPIVG